MSRKATRASALRYERELGWNVLPLRGKKPASDLLPRESGKWNPYKENPATRPEILAWPHDDPRLGVGKILQTTPEGLHEVVLDFDDARPPDGLLLLETPIVLTPSGNYHIYFLCPSPIKPHQFRNDEGDILLEIRSDRQYVAVPPSPGYTWINSAFKFSPAILTEAILLSIPEIRQAIEFGTFSLPDLQSPTMFPRSIKPRTRKSAKSRIEKPSASKRRRTEQGTKTKNGTSIPKERTSVVTRQSLVTPQVAAHSNYEQALESGHHPLIHRKPDEEAGEWLQRLFSEWDIVDVLEPVLKIPAGSRGAPFSCPLPGHEPDKHPSANLWKNPETGYVLLRCRHGKDDWHTFPLPDVYASCRAGRIVKLDKAQPRRALSSLHLLHEAGLLEPLPVKLPKLPLEVEENIRIARAEFQLMLGLKWRVYQNGESTSFGPQHLADRTGMSLPAARDAIRELERLGVIERGGTYPSYGKEQPLFLPAGRQRP